MMKAASIIILMIICYVSVATASDVKVNATVLKDETVFIIRSKNQAILRNEFEAIIHNKYAKKAKQISIYYDDFVSIKDVSVSIHSLDGKRIKKIKLKDFEDYGLGLSSVASDGRLKYYEPTMTTYPFIIKVSYELHKSGSLHYPVWNPQNEENIAIDNASFTVEDFSGNGFQYKAYQVSDPAIEIQNGAKTYEWKVKDLPPFEFEDFNYSWEDYTAVLYTSPIIFEMDGIEGDMSSWESFGQWIAKLNTAKDDLTGLDLSELDKEIENTDLEIDKIRLVYEYLQNNTRYVSIQLGIGGWQPFEASFVHEKKFGDCKALSNYTRALLDRYQVRSYYTLINAGGFKNNVEEDFPNAHFNHAIVTVPLENDTIFLECTSQTNPFGYMGTFTSNRNALMITPEGGKLISTKKYLPAENVQSTIVEIDLSEEDNANIRFERNYKGLEIDNHNFQSLYWKDSKEIEKWVRENHEWGGEKINSIELADFQKNQVPETGYVVAAVSKSEYVSMGDRKFISIQRYVDSHLRKMSSRARKTPIQIRYGYSQNDTIRYQLDKFHSLESGLPTVKIVSEFGYYYRELKKDEDKIIYIRKFQLNDGEYAVEEYEAFRDFVQKVRKADQAKFVLLEKT